MSARRVVAAAVVAGVLAWPSRVAGHRLDEYLQATRVSVDVDRVRLEMDLSPGVDIADAVIASIDADGDGQVRDSEADAYAAEVLRAVTLTVDGRPLALRAARRAFPSPDDMRLGVGTIRLVATASLPTAAGHRRLAYANVFLPGMSVYLVNALVPSDHRIQLGDQARDPLQRTFTLDYVVAGRQAWLGWSGGAVGLMVMLVVGRKRSSRSIRTMRL